MNIIVVPEKTETTSATFRARQLHREKGRGPFRAPHHSVSEVGAIAELALAAGGVYLMDEAREWRSNVRASVLRTWALMPPEARPVLVVDTSGETKLRPLMPNPDDLVGLIDPLAFDLVRACSFAAEALPKKPLPFSNHPREVERQIIVPLVEDLLSAGYLVGVNDGEENVLEPCSDSDQIFAAMSTTDEDILITKKQGHSGWVRLIYGNDADVISDNTVNIPESIFARANEVSERFQ